jgi:formate dehydrogenase subunit delta
MDTANLIHMANRIGDFFAAMPERDEALDGIADHIKKFWDPRMRRELLGVMEAGEAGDLHEIVRSALERHRGTLVPTAQAG